MRYLFSRPAQTNHPALLLIHGLLGYAFSWRFNIAELARHASVYAPDLPGMGFSDRPACMDRSLSGLAGYLLRFMDAAGLNEVDVVGTSHGGGIAIMLAATAPERVRRLVLVAPVNPWSRHGYWFTRMLATNGGRLLFRCAAPGLSPLNHYLLQRLYGDPGRIREGTLEAYSKPLAFPGTLDHLLGVVGSWHSDLRQLSAALPRICDKPTQLIWGSQDRAVWPVSAQSLLRRFSAARLVVLPGVGHMPYEETPDEFNRAVTEFLYQANA